MGPSSESPDTCLVTVRRGVDCGGGGGSFMARKASNGAVSPNPRDSDAPEGATPLLPPASPGAPHGEAAGEAGPTTSVAISSEFVKNI